MSDIPETVGVILAGGLSRRMGGGDKPLQLLDGETLLQRVIRIIRPQCAVLILNANGDPRRFATTGLDIVPDSVSDFPGPLAGVLAALDWTAHHLPTTEWVVSVAGDAPFLPPDLVARLHEACRASGKPVAQAESGGHTHPVNALWHMSLRDDLRRELVEKEQRKVGAFTSRHSAVTVVWPADPVDPFFNANTHADLAEADRLLNNRGVGS